VRSFRERSWSGIERILRLSRFEAFAELPQRETIELADFIESIVSDADFEATARRRRVSIARAEICRVAGDRELLREAVENIVRNGIRYTPEGTVVTVDAHRAGPAEYQIGIRDCGPGVAREHLEAIFEPFYRAPQQPDSAGFGIGLAIAKRAVCLHQGTVTAHNVTEGGFEVAIHLPVLLQENSLTCGSGPDIRSTIGSGSLRPRN
jgi:signal transduction histidine kinase